MHFEKTCIDCGLVEFDECYDSNMCSWGPTEETSPPWFTGLPRLATKRKVDLNRPYVNCCAWVLKKDNAKKEV